MKPFYSHRPLRFDCTGCGQCCTGAHPDYYIEVSPVEAERIRKHLRVTRAWFRRRYLHRFDDGVLSLRMEGGRCVFLGFRTKSRALRQGRRARRFDPQRGCRIYALRPAQCRHYPVWPELMSAAAWRLEARRCEGIGRGTAIPLAEIRRRLRAQAAPSK